MKVICISDKWITDSYNKNKPRPSIGDIDIVITVEMDIEIGMVFYQLERFDPNCWYRCDMFATLPDQPGEIIKEQSVNLQPA